GPRGCRRTGRGYVAYPRAPAQIRCFGLRCAGVPLRQVWRVLCGPRACWRRLTTTGWERTPCRTLARGVPTGPGLAPWTIIGRVDLNSARRVHLPLRTVTAPEMG